MLIMKSIRPRSISSMTQPPRPAGVSAPATVSPMVVSLAGRQHLVGVDVAGLGQPAGVEGLESPVDQRADLGAPRRPVVTNLLSLEILTGAVARGSGRSVGHVAENNKSPMLP